MRVQLFDLENDPWEMSNLADNPEYAAKLRGLKESIGAWMKQQGDEGAVSPHTK